MSGEFVEEQSCESVVLGSFLVRRLPHFALNAATSAKVIIAVLEASLTDVRNSVIVVNTEFRTRQGLLEEVKSDLLLVPYPQIPYGVNGIEGLDLKYRVGLGHQIAALLTSIGICSDRDLPESANDIAVFDTQGLIAPSHVMLVGTVPLMQLGYEELYDFPRRALRKLLTEGLTVAHITTTVHRVFGLDAGESVQNLVIGFLKGLKDIEARRSIHVTFVEQDSRILRTIRAGLDAMGMRVGSKAQPPFDEPGSALTMAPENIAAGIRESGTAEGRVGDKPHIFVAMPYAEEFQDVYEFGIYGPVRRCGYICEKVDETSFTGDILHRIKQKIESAKIVIADLSGSRPNVYLEVGYAWGHGVPVVFLSKEGEPLHFDVQTHRCIYYKTIGQLARDLERFLRQIG